ncbi:MerR family transcriptional regulator [Coriobacteriia bacterium Es71-Z0120]|uniref:transcriptional regulator FtsR n=1 Tax=Parvivirga hydrogeniphila TaxID=2939460 RepID=UPI002260B25F|nr:MerR family transcriptional regulator [Parvivirga hydrogeniphila]MCL4079659.1 MerR family transcriptional regulator [Parvivirga hydrogeniphila]
MPTAHKDYMTIGEVVEKLKARFPDLTISKVRFLEEEGLVSPERTAGGYRKFHEADVSRLELVLTLQKEHYMPLAVIRERLDDLDKGRVPSDIAHVVASSETARLPLEAAETVPLSAAPESLGIPVAFLRELEDFGLIAFVKGESGDELPQADVAIAHACWDLRKFGIEPRHLRMYETFAEREAAFFSQVLMPAYMSRTPEVRQQLLEALAKLTELTATLKSALLHRALARTFEDVT